MNSLFKSFYELNYFNCHLYIEMVPCIQCYFVLGLCFPWNNQWAFPRGIRRGCPEGL